jgi:hypothetical protein
MSDVRKIDVQTTEIPRFDYTLQNARCDHSFADTMGAGKSSALTFAVRVLDIGGYLLVVF